MRADAIRTDVGPLFGIVSPFEEAVVIMSVEFVEYVEAYVSNKCTNVAWSMVRNTAPPTIKPIIATR